MADNNTIEGKLKVLKVINLAFIFATAAYIFVCYVVSGTQDLNAFNSGLSGETAIILSALGLFFFYIVSRYLLRAITGTVAKQNDIPLAKKIDKYQQAHIKSVAALEAYALFCVVLFFLSKDQFYIYGIFAVLFLLIILRPKPETIAMHLELDLEEKKELGV
ncbi:MAG: hypothetical protein Kapaf2KO_20830 [Candidatus Kapaibacteriales bacterium]